MENLNVLVEAKREYMEQLSILICPVMIDVFDAMHQEAHNLSKGRKVLIMFQKLLKDVPEWNDTMAKQHTDNIADRCAWFRDLVAAVFVSSVKILSAVRLSKDSKKMSVKLPTNEVFIHTCYKNAAKELYKDPYIFSETQSEHARNDRLYDRFTVCVEMTVKELIPVQQILQTYMSAGTDEFVNGEDADLQNDDIDEYDEEAPQEPHDPMGEDHIGDTTEPMGEHGDAPPLDEMMEETHEDEGGVNPEMQEYADEPPAAPFQNEFRTIRSRPERSPVQQQDEPEDLFSDATDTRTKKLGY
jgi:hypothetical protein|tara:strand:+ start:9302 stop:10201 length:900 start_codon:yes stop_codon:yes gene_type:complete